MNKQNTNVAVIGGAGLACGVATLLDGSTITVHEITYGQWLESLVAGGTDFDNEVTLVAACTNIPHEMIDEYLAPDFKTLKTLAIKLNNPQKSLPKGATQVTLSKPVITIMGDHQDTITITMPKVKASRELSLITDSTKRFEYMIKAATGIADLHSMPMSDYSLLVEHIPDFFEQGADYFTPDK